ncbi:MAG: hypothetical protein OQK82_06250 [Candidatus Pacearchaeota archaeon]|nr:hypothetical protein [Candidatus Pacearchaeota archaeon]
MVNKRGNVVSRQDIINNATYEAVDFLRHKYGVGINSQKFSSYLDSGKLKNLILSVENDAHVRELGYNAKMKVLTNMIKEYIIDAKPFNQRGRNILFGGLEAAVSKPSFFQKFQKFFPNRKKAMEKIEKKKRKEISDYLSKLEAVEGLKYNVEKNPQFYSKNMPDLVKMLGESEERMEYNKIAETLYSPEIPQINDSQFGMAKAKFVGYAGNVINLAKEKLSNYLSGKENISKSYKSPKMESYIPNVALASILGIFGFGLIVASGLRLTGNIIGGVSGFGSGLIGGALLLISIGLFLFGRTKK